KSCKICIQSETDPNFGYCRPCCAGQGLQGSCTSCSPVTCGAGQTCVPLNMSNDKVCYPSMGTGADLCQPCGTTTCLNGATCIDGRCHATCNPSSPGTCSACLPQGMSGLCACPGEMAMPGAACGTSPFRACANGTPCVNGT